MADRWNDMARILFGTDFHYLAPSLTDGGECFTKLVEKGDGKLPERSREIVDEFVELALEKKPDVVIVAGDLTYNGEYQSLAECASKLKALKAQGIPVLVIPGNHDIAYPFACRYEKDKAYRVKNVSGKEFQEICGALGYDDAISRCTASFSYVFEIPGKCRILMLDTNTEKAPGRLDDETLAWAGEALAQAREAELPVIGVTHQNVLRQSHLLYRAFVIGNEDEMRTLYLEGNVRTNFSGHSHICHSASVSLPEGKGTLVDHAVGCMTVYPLSYAWIEAEPSGAIQYTPGELSCCREEAEVRFDVCTSRQVRETLDPLPIPDADREAMIRYAVKVNKAYFSGRLAGSFQEEPEWELWRRYAKATFWFAYFSAMTEPESSSSMT